MDDFINIDIHISSIYVYLCMVIIARQIIFEQVLKRNREPHSGTRWSKGTENKRSTSTTVMATAVGSSTHTVDELASCKRQLEQLREENQTLKDALEEVNRFYYQSLALDCRRISKQYRAKSRKSNTFNVLYLMRGKFVAT